MKMRLLPIIFITLLIITCATYAQNFDSKISEARSAYKSGNLDDARTALQEALNEVNMAIGKEVLELLPKAMKDLSFNAAEDDVNGTGVGYAGLYELNSGPACYYDFGSRFKPETH
jgi:hypothetical protein